MRTDHDLKLGRWTRAYGGKLLAALVTAGRNDLADALIGALGTTRGAVAESAARALAELGLDPEPAA